jgi:hypothetical protein
MPRHLGTFGQVVDAQACAVEDIGQRQPASRNISASARA